MKRLSGSKSDVAKYRKAEWYCDLIEHGVSLLGLFRQENRLFLSLWAEREKNIDRYLFFPVRHEQLSYYLRSEVSLRELLEAAKKIFAYEDDAGSRKNFRQIAYSDIPSEYIPAEDSYFDERFATDDAARLAREDASDYYINIDGDWYLDDWSGLMHTYKQVYAFNHAAHNLDVPSISSNVRPNLDNLPFRGGYSIVHLWNSMHAAIPATGRVRVNSIRYSSPGHIGLKVDITVAQDVEKAVAAILDSDAFDALREVYRNCDAFLGNNGLRKLESSQFNDSFALYADLAQQLREYAAELLGRLYLTDELGMLNSNENVLPLVKTLLAYVRRLVKLRRYIDDGLITKLGGAPLPRDS